MALSPKHSFVGSTPERLYRRRGQELETEALAGTIGRGGNASHDMQLSNWLTQDVKNINENQYVVDDIQQSLAPHSRMVAIEEELRLVRLRKVQHLKRNIHAQLNAGINGVQLLQALQPTAAVAGLPRQAAMQYIEQNEPFARGWYAGSVGYLSHDGAEFCVAIRSALIVEDQLQLFAGAGIVPGSVAEHEWQELDKKMSTLLSLITEQSVTWSGIMMAHQAALNRVWTKVMLEALYRQGVRHLCIAPGSRSTPLTLEAVAHGGFTLAYPILMNVGWVFSRWG